MKLTPVSRRLNRSLLLASLALALSSAVGCASDQKPEGYVAPLADVTAGVSSYDVPPKAALVEIKRVLAAAPLNLGIAEERKGMLVTNWESHDGDFHVARRWQERTRYIINVAPDWDDPVGRSTFYLREETQQRPTANHEWDGVELRPRPERAANVIASLNARLAAMQKGK